MIAAGATGVSPAAKVVLVVFVALFVLIGVIFLLLWLRRRQKSTADKGLRPNRLKKVYSRFLKPLPWRARGALRAYPWAVVLGDAGAGKTQLISSHVDWQGQLNQFFPSYTADPLLQIYLGGRVVVQEVAAPLLADSSPAGKEALRRLWGPLCKRMPPTALVVLSYRALRHSTPEQIQRHAQLLRGKLNLLSELLGEPVRTRVCMTFMDRQPGFSEFVRLLSQHGFSISVPLHTDSGELVSFENGLAAQEKYLPLALTSLSASEFRVLVEFLVNSPSVLSGLSASLRILGEEIAFSQTPAFDRLYFSAEGLQSKLPNPFFVRALKPHLLLGKLGLRPLGFLRSLFDLHHVRAHVIGCAVVAGLAALIYGSLYYAHSRRMDAASSGVESFEAAITRAQKSLNPPAESEAVRAAADEAGGALLRLRHAEEGRPILWRLHQDEKQADKNHFLAGVRRAYLLPALDTYRQPKDRDRFIYTLGALYAGRHNTLGQEIHRAPAQWAAAVPMPEEILLKYVDLSDPPWDDRVPTTGGLPTQDVAQSPAADLAPWLAYLTVLDAAFTGPTITRTQLQRLQQVTRRFSEGLAQALKNRAAEHILRVLSEEGAVDLKQLFGPALAALMPPAWLADNADRLNALFQMILTSSLEPPRAEQLQLTELMSLLGNQPGSSKLKDVVYAFELSNHSFRFSTLRWQELLSNSRRHDLLAGVIDEPSAKASSGGKTAKHKRRRKHSSSKKSSALSAVVAPSEKDLGGEIPGSDSIPALYTRPGFEKEMKPNLLDAEKKVAEAPLSPEQKQQVARILMAQAKRYAKNYRDAQLSYLMGYKPRGDSLVDVVGMLTDLLQPSSPLLDRLRTIADNAALGPLTGPYFEPMNAQLPALSPLSRVATQKDGAYPEYDKYKAIIAKLIKDVSSTTPDEPATGFTPGGAAADPKAAPKPGAPPAPDAPTGAARVAIAVLQGQEGSPLRQIEVFLDAEGIVGELRKPFIAPLLRVNRLGTQDLEKSVASKWNQEYAQHVAPLVERFPFNRHAKGEVSPADFAPIHPPDGAFWTFVQRQVAPLCSERPDGTLAPLRGPLGGVKLPEDLLTTLGKVRRLSRALWGPDGAQKAVALSVKALPLPPAEGAPQLVTQTFLSCSNVSVNGYNQMPEAKSFPVPWWKQENSAVGIELGAADSKARRYQSIDVNNSQWSFYRLLDKAKWGDGNVATWQIANEGEGAAWQVRFAFDSDPWSIFQLQSGGSQP
jgi:type VI secretion system protein ImpL